MAIVGSAAGRVPVFFGWRVVAAAFVLAMFGWGFGFYGPPIFLHAVATAHGWDVALVSAAVTAHFLAGTLVIANLPRLYRRFGLGAVTRAGSVALALGILGWALAAAPWQLFGAALLSGAGWVTMAAAPVNAIVSTWFVRRRPAALAAAYNGASLGGVVFSPLWVVAIERLGFPLAAALLGSLMVTAISFLAGRYLARTPAAMGLAPDGDPPEAASAPAARATAGAASELWRDRRFLTLTLGMSLALVAQIGLLAHLFSLLVPALGAEVAGMAAGLATAAAIAGRTIAGWAIGPRTDRRIAAATSLGVQAAGGGLLIAAGGSDVPLLMAGVLLFGAGIGNATSLPPLIAQAELPKETAARAVPLAIATAQAAYAFAPAAFGLLRGGADAGDGTLLLAVAAALQLAAIGFFLAGRSRPGRGEQGI